MSSSPTHLPAWELLKTSAGYSEAATITDLFDADPQRPAKFSRQVDEIYFDLSKQRITETQLQLLVQLAEQAKLPERIADMFAGAEINETESRAVLHTELRSETARADVKDVRDRMASFATDIASGNRTGATEKQFRDVVNIGIGGSDLGPQMVYEALRPPESELPLGHYVSNVDPIALEDVLRLCNPETTLFIVASKTFTTIETMTNAKIARDWLTTALGADAIPDHFVAVSTNHERVEEFGITPEATFGFWDWVGGRFSVCSSIGLSLNITLGPDVFSELLAGAAGMDQHFQTAPLTDNVPVLLALLEVWNTNFMNYTNRVVVPYSQRMNRFCAYLQQLEMESNGKSVGLDEAAVEQSTSGVVWGEPGTNSQHAFFQMLHQGTQICPVDFIGFANPPLVELSTQPRLIDTEYSNQILLASMFAQSAALAFGKASEDPHRNCPGNRPSTTILAKQLNAKTLGALIAMFEHKTMAVGTLWGVNPFDQFGVELGKKLAKRFLPALAGAEVPSFDSSTNELIKKLSEFQ